MPVVVLIAAFGAIAAALPSRDDFRDRLLRASVIFGIALLGITELLSAFAALHRLPLLAAWLAVIVTALVLATRQGFLRRLPSNIAVPRDPIGILCLGGIATILVLTGVTAACSPPNSADAMAYHMPRVVYWAEQASIRFFPTPYLNQVMLQPLAEYFVLHTYVLSGGDHFANFVQWTGSLGSVLGVSLVARLMGADARGQWVAALFCATLPSGVLAASGAKNDYFLAMWLVAAIYFAGRLAKSEQPSDALALGGALGLAMLTKATAYLFAPWLLAAILARSMRRLPRHLLAAGVCALLLNTPHYLRNLDLSGSILGFDSAHGDGFFRWRNETFGWRQTASNILRNLSDQLGGRSERQNRAVYDWVSRAHNWIGIGVNDPSTTWRWSTFGPPKNANHEADANSRWHLLILAICGCILLWRAAHRGNRTQAWYVLALLAGFVTFCVYLKWQPFLARLFLPLLVAGAPVAGLALPRKFIVQALVCLFLLSTARRPALENWTRPLRGPRSILRVSRENQYFADMVQWGDRETYQRTLAYLAGHTCSLIGLDATDLSLEYPLLALIRERQSGALFLHTGVQNVSSRYRPPVTGSPCAVVCLDCAGDTAREKLYAAYPQKATIDKFLVFTSR